MAGGVASTINGERRIAVESRKIQHERLGADLSRLSDVGRLPEVQRLGPPLQRPVARVTTEFEELATGPEAEDGRASTRIGRASPSAELAAFIMPRLSDPTILHTSRSLGIFEHLVAEIIPTFTESSELRAIAVAVITTEIARGRDLLAHIHGGIAA
jgi:hypothetical protein